MATVKIPDGELYYEVHGQGEPLILLHCGFFDSRNWKNQVGPFSKKFKVYLYDQRGFGQSSVPVAPHSPIEDLRVFMDSQGLQKASLVGHSLGSQIALDFAAVYPERVKKLVVMSASLDGYPMSESFNSWLATVFAKPEPQAMADRVLVSGMLSILIEKPDLMKEINHILVHNTGKLLAWKNGEVQWPNATTGLGYLERIQAPTLVVEGEKDIPDIHAITELLGKKIRNAKVMTIKGSDHMMNYCQPESFNRATLEFLEA